MIKRVLVIAGAAVLTLAAATGGATANLLTNGSFESGTFTPDGNGASDEGVGSTAITGWTVVGNTLSWDVNGAFGLFAQDGNHFLDLTGYEDSPPYAGVTQAISTQKGASYLLSFYLGSDPRYGLQDGITASAGSTSQNFVSSNDGSQPSLWQLETLAFTAAGSSTVITLLGFEANPSYIGLDNVSVIETAPAPTPLPSAGTMLLIGLAGLGFVRYRQSRQAAVPAAT